MKESYNSAQLVITAELFNKWLEQTSQTLNIDKDDLQELVKVMLIG